MDLMVLQLQWKRMQVAHSMVNDHPYPPSTWQVHQPYQKEIRSIRGEMQKSLASQASIKRSSSPVPPENVDQTSST